MLRIAAHASSPEARRHSQANANGSRMPIVSAARAMAV